MDFFKRLSDLASFLDNELHQIEASFHVIVNSGRKYDGPADISLEIQGQIQELSGKIDELIKIGDDQSDHFDGFLKGMIDTVAEFDEKIQRIENKCGLPKVPSFVSPKDKHTTTNATTTTEHNIDVDMEEDDDDSTISDP